MWLAKTGDTLQSNEPSSYKTKHHWPFVDTHFNVFSIWNLLPSIIVFLMIWLYWSPVWLIQTRPCGKAEPSNALAIYALIQPKYTYFPKWYIALAVHLFINQYSHPTAYNSCIVSH
jgi:hypothetical protein